jgi:O-antigen ligase
MLNRLEAAARLLIRTLVALFTGVVLLLIQPALWSNTESVWLKVTVIAIALLAYFRPEHAVLALAVIVPFGQVGAHTVESMTRGAEALVLAFLAGALLRGWTLHRFQTFPSNRLHIAVLLFGAVVAASCVEQIWFLQIQRDFAGPFLQDLTAYAIRSYLSDSRGYGMISNAMLLLEGLALLLYVAHYSSARPAFASRVVFMLILGAASAAVLNVLYMGSAFAGTGQPLTRFIDFLSAARWTAHVADVNAAGSFFAMGLFMAFGVAVKDPARRPYWIVAGLVCGLAMWLTASRTAVVAALLVAVFCATALIFRRSSSVLRTTTVTAAALVLLGAALVQYSPASMFGREVAAPIQIRWLFLGTTWRMLDWQPLFGVGVGQYAFWSLEFSSPELLSFYNRENAHNNFAQVAGELGVVGFAAFILMLGVALWRRHRQDPDGDSLRGPVIMGLAVFLLTWLGGHPLLVPEVSYPFWIALGVAAGMVSAGRSEWKSATVVAVAAGVLLASLPFRVESKAATLDSSRIRYGFTGIGLHDPPPRGLGQ